MEDESNVGLVAASSIEAGVVVLAVPVKCIVTPNDGVHCHCMLEYHSKESLCAGFIMSFYFTGEMLVWA